MDGIKPINVAFVVDMQLTNITFYFSRKKKTKAKTSKISRTLFSHRQEFYPEHHCNFDRTENQSNSNTDLRLRLDWQIYCVKNEAEQMIKFFDVYGRRFSGLEM